MASGTLFSLALSQQSDEAGKPLGGCQLSTWLAGTTTRYTTFQTSALLVGQENPWPLVADASGRIPPFWLDSANTYKARLTTATGVLIFEYDAVPAIGPGVGGGGVDTTDPNSIFSTGDYKWRASSGTLGGWVRANKRTIGSATSGASEFANATAQALFEYLWQTFSDTICPVVGGRGASSAADWAANKQITLPDLRGRSPFGLDDMGNTVANRLTGATFLQGSATSQAATGGEAAHILTQAQLPNVNFTVSGITLNDPGHFHNRGLTAGPTGYQSGGITPAIIGGSDSTDTKTTGITVATQGSAASGGSGSALNVMNPFILGTWYIRL